MKSKLLIFTILLAFWHQNLVANPVTEEVQNSLEPSPPVSRVEALKLYKQKEFSQSIKVLSNLAIEEGESADLLFNLFLNHQQLGNRGPALHSLRKSLEVKPGYGPSQKAIQNLQAPWARIFQTKKSTLQKFSLELHYSTSSGPILWVSIILLGLFLRSLIPLIKNLRATDTEEPTRLGFFIFSCLCLLVSTGLLLSKLYIDSQERATLISSVQARLTPSDSSPEILGLKEGEQVVVHSRKDTWLQIEDAQGSQAWLPADSVLFSTKGL